MTLLFHCCCAPCSIACIESLSAEGITTVPLWYNHNIHLFTEYQNRRDALAAFCAAENLPMEMINEYGLQLFLQSTGQQPKSPERCEICYRLRLKKTVTYALEKGFDTFSTSLLISPYQKHEVIRRLGEELETQYGIGFLYRDFRSLFRKSQTAARSLGLYIQKYCGCIYSDAEKHESEKT
jgi:predicted adenine nucleotide alpha hydrolase (AANH) superfamily ATPase